ncbi:MAG: M15 family metallopeptidase [Legionella sp.]|jgi:hypothetical protein
MKFVSEINSNTVTPVTDLPEVIQKLNPESWPQGYPVPMAELVFIKLLYWGFDDQEHVGELIAHRELAQDLLEIFLELHLNHFPIEQMRPVWEFNNSDDASMEANNTSAFNCREVTGCPGIFSQHAYGRAIDINPKINPYVKESKNLVLPESGREFVDREKPSKGKISHGSLPYTLFSTRGWSWGGNWNDLQDYQHFEKRAEDEIRPKPSSFSPAKILDGRID